MDRINGAIKNYDWGDHEFIPGFLGLAPDGRPWAELWLGTHRGGAAHLADGRSLVEVCGELPYLLKVLAAAHPLSLQTHPNAEQARRGHAEGRYGDPSPKPELLCALTRFEAFCGVRPVAETLELLALLGIDALAQQLARTGPGATLAALYRGELETAPIVAACARSDLAPARWVVTLDDRYPGQPSVVATLLLNYVALEPGQAIGLEAGNLHAYLHGCGIELMAPSDNVVRGGLTSKPVDVDDLLAVVDPTPLAQPILTDTDGYHLSGTDLVLRRVDTGRSHRAVIHELAIDLDGGCWYVSPGETVVFDAPAYVVTQAL